LETSKQGMALTVSIQESFLPDGICYGCGPANPLGLRLQSYEVDNVAVAHWRAQPHHAAVPGVVCGGVIGTLIDCHSGAALAQAVKHAEGRWPWAEAPGWATAAYRVEMLRPTPLNSELRLEAASVDLDGDQAVVAVQLHADGKLRAVGEATWRRLRARPDSSLSTRRVDQERLEPGTT
jgi:acyl-coenzyme A thioesterase PaaI-like protein